MSHPVHRTQVRVRYVEVDRLGQLHSSRFAVFMEMARTEMLRDAGMTYRDLEARGVFLVVARLGLMFHRPIRYDDMVTLEARVERATSARIDHGYRFVVEGQTAAEGRTTLACVDRDGSMQRMPDDLLALLGID